MTDAEFIEATDKHLGVCIQCGKYQRHGVPLNARKLQCPKCLGLTVYGMEELLFMGLIEYVKEDK